MDTDIDHLVRPDDFNKINDVVIFYGPILSAYRTVGRDDLKELSDSGTRFVLLDALHGDSYAKEHICGAVNMPVASIERDVQKYLNYDDLIIVYSRNKDCAMSAVAADKLYTLGYENIFRYTGGIEEWKAAGLCLEGEKKRQGEKAEEPLKKAA